MIARLTELIKSFLYHSHRYLFGWLQGQGIRPVQVDVSLVNSGQQAEAGDWDGMQWDPASERASSRDSRCRRIRPGSASLCLARQQGWRTTSHFHLLPSPPSSLTTLLRSPLLSFPTLTLCLLVPVSRTYTTANTKMKEEERKKQQQQQGGEQVGHAQGYDHARARDALCCAVLETYGLERDSGERSNEGRQRAASRNA